MELNIKLVEQVREIINKHDLKPIEIPNGYDNLYRYKDSNPNDATNYYNVEKNDEYFLKKYHKHIPVGWYGFSIGTPIVPEWLDIIDDILELCIKKDATFEIHQIKLKFGGIRFYVHSDIIEDIHDVEMLIENKLYDKALIY